MSVEDQASHGRPRVTRMGASPVEEVPHAVQPARQARRAHRRRGRRRDDGRAAAGRRPRRPDRRRTSPMSLVVLLVAMQVRKPLEFAVFPTLVLVGTILRLALNVVLDPAGAARRLRRSRHRRLRALRHRRLAGRRPRRLRDPRGHPVRRWSPTAPHASPRSAPGSPSTRCPASRWRSTPTSTPGSSTRTRPGGAARRSPPRPTSTARWTVPRSSSRATRSPQSSSPWSTSSAASPSGMVQKGMPPGDAINTYSLLTVGDGLVSQIPALLMSVATGVIVTRSDERRRRRQRPGRAARPAPRSAADRRRRADRALHRARDAQAALPRRRRAPARCVDPCRGTVPTRVRTPPAPRPRPPRTLPPGPSPSGTPSPSRCGWTRSSCSSPPTSSTSSTPPAAVTCSTGSARCAARPRSTSASCCRRSAPATARPCRPAGYEIRIGGVHRRHAARRRPGTSAGDRRLARDAARPPDHGTGLRAARRSGCRWSTAPPRRPLGATLVERAAVVTTHLAEMVRRHASRLLSLDDVKELLDVLKADRPATVDEVVPGLLPLTGVQRVLQGLLDEQVSIRDLGRVLEGIGQRARITTDADALLEAARAALGPALTAPYLRDGVLHAITLEPDVESEARGGHARQRAGCRARGRPDARESAGRTTVLARHDCREQRRDPRAARRRPAAAAVTPAAAWQRSPRSPSSASPRPRG